MRSRSIEATDEGDPGRTFAADIEGPGALVRIEVRGFLGRVRIRVDGAEEPLIVVPGKPSEDAARPLCDPTPEGWILRLPVPFARHCRVDFEVAGAGSCDVVYRTYEPGTEVSTVTVPGLNGAREAIARAAEAWTRPARAHGTDTFTFSLSEEIPEGGLTCLDPKLAAGSRAITQIHLRAEATDLVRALRRARLRLSFDGETSVDCPLGDFFATAPEAEPHASRPFTVLPGVDEATGRPGTQIELVCRFVMPYRERFELSIDAKGAGDLHVAGVVRTMPWEWNERSLRFHAASESAGAVPVHARLEGPRIRIEGRGVLVGDSCSLGLEGEPARAAGPRVRADDGQWIADRLLATEPTRISRRFRELDRVPFQASLETAMALRVAGKGEVRLAATTYYYAIPRREKD